jgi:hypothetical protein
MVVGIVHWWPTPGCVRRVSFDRVPCQPSHYIGYSEIWLATPFAKILDHTKNIGLQNTNSAGANYEYQPTIDNIGCSRYRLRRFYGFEILYYVMLFIQQVALSLSLKRA